MLDRVICCFVQSNAIIKTFKKHKHTGGLWGVIHNTQMTLLIRKMFLVQSAKKKSLIRSPMNDNVSLINYKYILNMTERKYILIFNGTNLLNYISDQLQHGPCALMRYREHYKKSYEMDSTWKEEALKMKGHLEEAIKTDMRGK